MPPVTVWGWLNSVDAQEHDRGCEGRAFIAIKEGMIAANVKQVSGGHFGQVCVWGDSAETGLRRQNCGDEQVFIAKAVQAAKVFKGGRVDFADDIHSQMKTVGGSFHWNGWLGLRKFFERASIIAHGQIDCL